MGHSYTASVSIGTSLTGGDGPTLDLLIDTGSDMVVVTSTSCTAPECQQVADRYDSSTSMTCTPTVNLLTGSPRWVQSYGDGSVANGTLVEDTLRFISSPPPLPPQQSLSPQSQQQPQPQRVGRVVIPHQTLLVVDQPGLGLFKSYGPGVDGILGLNLQSPVINRTVIQNLQALDDTSFPLSSSSSSSPLGMGFMSLWLGTSLEPGQGGGLLLNAVDKIRFRGPIQWVNRGPSPYDWSIPLDRGILLVDSTTSNDTILDDSYNIPPTVTGPGAETSKSTTTVKKAPFLVPETDYSFAVLDSGSDGIYLQRFMYDAFFPQIPGSKQLDNGYWRVPCEGSLDLVVGIQGEIYRIPYEDWVKKPTETAAAADPKGLCQARVFGSSPGPILLGTAFLRQVYTIFDFSHPGQERVGLAALAKSSP